MVKVTWTKKALKDLKDIYDYISKDSLLYAIRFTDKLLASVDQLENFPYSGRIIPEKNDETHREILTGNYRIFHKVHSSNQIYVLRIHHSARNIK